MSAITTHVLDTARGRPAAGVPVRLELLLKQYAGGSEEWVERGRGTTDADGRIKDLVAGPVVAGVYRLTFDTAAYFRSQKVEAFYPYVEIVFEVRDPSQHHHVPLLLSPFGYSTYRGS
jgi:5-hydroxyisourate hydrolase